MRKFWVVVVAFIGFGLLGFLIKGNLKKSQPPSGGEQLESSITTGALRSLHSLPVPVHVQVLKGGDTLWNLYGPSWRYVVELEGNSFLKQPGRIYERDGLTIALIYPGEKILFRPLRAGLANRFTVNLK